MKYPEEWSESGQEREECGWRYEDGEREKLVLAVCRLNKDHGNLNTVLRVVPLLLWLP